MQVLTAVRAFNVEDCVPNGKWEHEKGEARWAQGFKIVERRNLWQGVPVPALPRHVPGECFLGAAKENAPPPPRSAYPVASLRSGMFLGKCASLQGTGICAGVCACTISPPTTNAFIRPRDAMLPRVLAFYGLSGRGSHCCYVLSLAMAFVSGAAAQKTLAALLLDLRMRRANKLVVRNVALFLDNDLLLDSHALRGMSGGALHWLGVLLCSAIAGLGTAVPPGLEPIFRSTRDGARGATAKAFHALCDGQGCTLTLVKDTEGFVFGGYASESWSSNPKAHVETGVEDPTVCLFSVTAPWGGPPEVFPGTCGTKSFAMHGMAPASKPTAAPLSLPARPSLTARHASI